MNWIDALLLGIVQGLAEYLPISSSGHLEIFNQILNVNLSGADSMQFDLVLHVATVLSTLVILWKEFVPLCTSFFTLRKDENTTYVLKILVSCIPVAIVGFGFKDMLEGFFGGNLLTVGICLIITAALLSFAYFTRTRHYIAADALAASEGRKAPEQGRDISWCDAFVIGLAQAVAVLPGLSRSGTTIATGILLGDNREKVARFSFFMVIIPILGEALLDILKMLKGGEAAAEAVPVGWLPLLVGFVAAFIVGCAACKWMLEIVKKGKLVWFALYCLCVGLVCILW